MSGAPNDDVRHAARALALAARRLERAAGDLTLAQFRVLAAIAAGDERASLIAERLAVAKPTITAVVDGLVERGYVAREAVEGDRRSLRVYATKAGQGALDAAEIAMASALEDVLEYVGDRDALISALCDLDAAMLARFKDRVKPGADTRPGS